MITGGNAVICGALKNREMIGLLGDHRRALDPARPGADQADTLPRKIDLFLWPQRGVVDLAAKGLEPRDGWFGRCRRISYTSNKKAGLYGLTFIGLDEPPVRLLVVTACQHARAEFDVFLEVELVGHEIQIAEDLGLSRVAAAPFPSFSDFVREGIAIVMAFGVAARAGIAIPEPRSANAIGGLDQTGGEALLPQPVQHV